MINKYGSKNVIFKYRIGDFSFTAEVCRDAFDFGLRTIHTVYNKCLLALIQLCGVDACFMAGTGAELSLF